MLCVRIFAVSSLLTLAIGCGDGYSSPPTSPSPAPTPAPDGAPVTGATSSSVTIPMGAEDLGNRAYDPGEVSVSVGGTVTWMNTDTVSHTSTSNGSGWNSGIIAPGRQFSAAFSTRGTFQYHCAIHPGMVGTVVVR
jgi:plastocyanin